MNTNELLEAYTKANNSRWSVHNEMARVSALLQDTVKDRTQTLRAAVKKILRSTEWGYDGAKYMLSIRHDSTPVTAALHGQIEVSRLCKVKGRAFMRYEFSPDTEAAVMVELRRLVLPNDEAQPRAKPVGL